MVRYADFTGKTATNKTLLAIFRATFNGERVDEEVTVIQIDKDVMERHSPRWKATFNQEDPLPETKPMANGKGFEIQVQNPVAYYNVLAACHNHSIFSPRDITVQDLFDISIMAEKQALWKGIINDAEKWLIWCAFGDFENNSTSVFLQNPIQWLVISYLWGIQSIFTIVHSTAIAEAHKNSFTWVPEPPKVDTGHWSIDSRKEDQRLSLISARILLDRNVELQRYFQMAQAFERHLLSAEPCHGNAWGNLYKHDGEKCKEKLLRSLQRTCTALDREIEHAVHQYEASPNTLFNELEAVAAGLDQHDNISKTICNTLKTAIAKEKSGAPVKKAQIDYSTRLMVYAGASQIGLEASKVARIDSRVLQMAKAE